MRSRNVKTALQAAAAFVVLGVIVYFGLGLFRHADSPQTAPKAAAQKIRPMHETTGEWDEVRKVDSTGKALSAEVNYRNGDHGTISMRPDGTQREVTINFANG